MIYLAHMKSGLFSFLTKILFGMLFFTHSVEMEAQDNRDFWERTRFGGSLAVAFGSGYTDVTVAPGFLYEVNEFVGLGAGVQGTYVQQRNYFSAFMYGGRLLR